MNTTSIGLFYNLLAREDYVDAAEKLNHLSDIMNLLEFTIFVLRNRYFANPDPNVDTNQRARRLMSKIISKSPVIPRYLFLTGLKMPRNRNLIGLGGFGNIYKNEHEGKPVALKVLVKAHDNIVRHLPADPFKSLLSISCQKQDFCREALMWGSLHHTSILPFLGIYEDGHSSQFLVSPYMKNGTLRAWRERVIQSMLEVEMRVRFIFLRPLFYSILTCPTYESSLKSLRASITCIQKA